MYTLCEHHATRTTQCRPLPVAFVPCIRSHRFLRPNSSADVSLNQHINISSVQQRGLTRSLATGQEGQVSISTKTSESWWKKESDLWVEVHDEAAWEREVLQSSQPVVVDWYASWCAGCQKSYPEVCKVVKSSAELRNYFKFVKVCVDEFPKTFSRTEGVTALPRMSLYRPGQGRVLTWDIPASRVRHLKHNLNVAKANPNSALTLDPNNFVVPSGPASTLEELARAAASKAAAIQELEKHNSGLFERLSSIARGDATPSASYTAVPSNGQSASVLSTSLTGISKASDSSVNNAVSFGAGASANGNGQKVQFGSATYNVATAAAAPAAPSGAAVTDTHVSRYMAMYGHAYMMERQMFLQRYGDEYGYDGRIDELYPKEVGVRLGPVGPDKKPQHYMDYTGSSVYCQSQLEAAFKELSGSVFGNPHAQNPSSELASERIDEVRTQLMHFLNADPSEWQLIFTHSATGALKLVGETFPWTSGSLFRYLRENHNSVLGIREYALSYGAAFQAVDEGLVQEWVHSKQGSKYDHEPGHCTGTNATGICPADSWTMASSVPGTSSESDNDGAARGAAGPALPSVARPASPTIRIPTSSDTVGSISLASSETDGPSSSVDVFPQPAVTYSLFAFPAEENFAGVKYPLSWAAEIKKRSTQNHKWMVIVDAAAYLPTHKMDLSQLQADFVDLSFYKLFGYPSGLGALMVRTEAVPLLRKVFWGGGSVSLATSGDNFHVLKCRPAEKLEDGTVSFLDIISTKHGLAMMQQLGGVDKIHTHVMSLTEWLYDKLSRLRHSNGAPLLHIYGKHAARNRREVQGGIVNFSLLDPTGQPLSYRTFEREAAAAGFHVRTGAECNPGACYAYLGVTEAEVESLAGVKEGCDDEVEFITVHRPHSWQQAGRVGQYPAAQALLETADVLNRPKYGNSKWINLPLGSARVSLGWMSTFEDCYTLVDFIAKSYKDRVAALPNASGQ